MVRQQCLRFLFMEKWSEEQRRAFGRRLGKARREKKIPQVEVATMFEISKQAVSHWETGRNMPSAEQLALMAAEYGVSVEYLITGNQPWPFGDAASYADVSDLPVDLLAEAKGMLRVLIAQAGHRMTTSHGKQQAKRAA